MSSNYWLKLYHEMLDDPKVMTLRPALRWRFVETLLVAGELNEGGYLPDVTSYAWRVRDNPEIVETQFTELADAGLLSREDGRWLVTKFAERQGAMTGAERMRRMREAARKSEYYGDDTKSLHESDEAVTKRHTDKDKDKDIDKDKNADGAVFAMWESDFGNLSPTIVDELNFAIDKHGAELVLYAMREAIKHDARNLSYVLAVCDNRKEDKGKPKAKSDKATFAWSTVEEAIKRGDGTVLTEHPDILGAVNAAGGWLRFKNAGSRDLQFARKDFMEKYDG